MCAAVAELLSPVKLTSTDRVSATVSSANSAKPVAVLAVDGDSFAPDRVASNIIVLAEALALSMPPINISVGTNLIPIFSCVSITPTSWVLASMHPLLY